MKEQTFSSLVKEEICQNEYSDISVLKALLSSYIRINGVMIFRNKKSILTLKTENAKIAKFIYQNINNLYDLKSHIVFANKGNTKKHTYTVSIEQKVDEIIKDLDISFLEGKISKNIVSDDNTISGYFAGAFLACGSVNSPKTSNYHLELALNNENYAKWLAKLFLKYKNWSFEPKIITRKDKYVIYFKKSDQIANFIILVGAVNACMEFENIRVDRDFVNSTNRLTNSDNANIKRVMETGLRQAKEIKVIDEKFGITNIANSKLRLLAELRLSNESLSLLELSILMSEKLNTTITRSNVNHLFRSLHDLYLRYSS